MKITDYRGREIKAGDPVAFNRSGEVRLGKFLRIVGRVDQCEFDKNKWFGRFDIQDTEDNRISKVKCTTSIAVLQ